MFDSNYLLLELDKAESDFYHLPRYVPYLKKNQSNLNEFGFEWELSVEAMRSLVDEMDADEYKPYRLFIKKWDFYKELAIQIRDEAWQEAEKTIDKILSIDLLDPSAYLNLGFIFRKVKEYQKAEQAYIKGLELLANNVPFLAGIARTYDEWGKEGAAVYAWKRVLEYSDDHEEALESLCKYNVYRKLQKINSKTQEPFIEYIPAEMFETLMEAEFDQCKDNLEALTKLGLRLMKESCPKLAMRVFARVYELSQDEEEAVTGSAS